MRATLTISLPKNLRRDLAKMAKAEGVIASEYVRRAIKSNIFRRVQGTSAACSGPRHFHR